MVAYNDRECMMTMAVTEMDCNEMAEMTFQDPATDVIEPCESLCRYLGDRRDCERLCPSE